MVGEGLIIEDQILQRAFFDSLYHETMGTVDWCNNLHRFLDENPAIGGGMTNLRMPLCSESTIRAIIFASFSLNKTSNILYKVSVGAAP